MAAAGIGHVIDVRSYPGSRRHPHFARDRMAEWLPASGIHYSWEPRLGGRRKPGDASRHTALENEAFRAYADHMQSDDFAAGVDAVVAWARAGAPPGAVAVMCAESLWWRCHRRLLADALVLLRRVGVEHLLHDGRVVPHQVTGAARIDGGCLVYDVAAPPTGDRAQ